jgi:hypothetical protein
MSAGASSPFFVVAPDREPIENSPFALGAEATRRMNREALAPTDFGLRGPFVRDRCGTGGVWGKVGWLASAFSEGGRRSTVDCWRRGLFGRALSDFVCCRDRGGVAVERPSVDLGCE